jgi:hypothetical protein
VDELGGEEDQLTRVNPRFCWIFVFNEKTGKVVKIRKYLTALVREVALGSCE